SNAPTAQISSKREHYACQYPSCHNRCDGNCVGTGNGGCYGRRLRYSISYYPTDDSRYYFSDVKCEKCGRAGANYNDYYTTTARCRECNHVYCSDCCLK
ncbi:unnamed protein product, partial [Rotaria sordida]